MSKIAVFWDSEMMFHRMVEDAAGPVEAVTPLILSAPFFRGKFSGIIVPTGFGNTSYSKMLPALRACAGRIEDYLEDGGKMLVYGAADAGPARYDWLPVKAEYHYEFMEHELDVAESSAQQWTGCCTRQCHKQALCIPTLHHSERNNPSLPFLGRVYFYSGNN